MAVAGWSLCTDVKLEGTALTGAGLRLLGIALGAILVSCGSLGEELWPTEAAWCSLRRKKFERGHSK